MRKRILYQYFYFTKVQVKTELRRMFEQAPVRF